MALSDWLKRRRLDDEDFDEEVRSHLAMAAKDRIADGAGQRDAELAARKDFGNVTLTTEAAQRVWRPRWVEALRDTWTDVRYAIRVLAKSPGFSLIVVAVLAIGIGLNATVFTFYKSLALNPLAGVDDSGSLAVVLSKTTGGDEAGVSYPDYLYLRDHSRMFSGVTGSAMSALNLGRGNRAERVMGEFVTGNYFSVLGVGAHLGRTFLPSDEVAPGQHPVVILGHGLWRRTFAADREIVGRTIHVNSHPFTVVGVAEPSFHGTVASFDIEVFLPVMMAPQLGISFQAFQTRGHDMLSDRTAQLLMILGRPQPDVPFATAVAQTAVLSAQLAADEPVDGIRERLAVLPIWESPYGAQTYMLPAITVVGAMGSLLLLIVSANIAGLVLVRGVSRRGEIAVRLALGASRARILRLLLTENLVLAIPGAALGLLLVAYAMPMMWSTASDAAPGRLFLDLSVDRLVIAFAVLASCACALLFGFMPALRSSQTDLMAVMKDDLAPRGAARGRLRAVLVVAQVALSVLLLVGAGLVSRSLEAATRANPGFDAKGVISMTLDVAPNGYDETLGRAFFQQLLDRARADASVAAATVASIYPMTMVEFPGQPVAVEGYAPQPDEDLVFLTNTVSPDYFNTLRIGLLTGREFSYRDDTAAAQVAIVNGTLARRFWGSATNALGKRVRVAEGEWRTVVGVASDIKYARIEEAPRPYVYLPFLQSYQSSMILHTRAKGQVTTSELIDQARAHVAAIDPDLPILYASSLAAQTGAALGVFAMTAVMLLIFGVAAMGLAAMGTYGLVSYSVKQSTHEIGIRVALGAQRTDVVRRFLARGLGLGAIGAAAGIAGSLAATRLLGSVLYEVSAVDPLSFSIAAAVVLGSVLVATLVPAWRAARINPMTALRQQ